MYHSPFSPRFLLALVVGLILLVGCQSTGGGTEVPGSGPMTATGVVQVTEVLRIPDSGVWRTSSASRTEAGNGKIVCVANAASTYDCSQSFGLKEPLGQDLLIQELHALGVNFATVTYSQIESQPSLARKTAVLNPLEDNLVRAFNASYKQSHPAGPPPTPADLLLYYAGRLLAGDTALAKKDLPKGLVADSVKKALVLAASKQGMPAKGLESKGLLQLTDPVIHSLLLVLIKEGQILDTTTLYPLPAVRVTEHVKVASDLVEGEGVVAVSGAFAWSAKAGVRKVDGKIKTSTGYDESVIFNFAKLPDFQSGSWVLTGNVTIQAKRGAHLGVDTLVVWVVGDSGADTSRTQFRVLAGDRTPPALAIVEPEDGSDVPNSTGKVKVVVEASDAKGIAEVKIGNVVVAKSPYAAEVDLAVGFNFIYVQAKDNSGNLAYDTVIVRRIKSTTSIDTTDPVLTLKSPLADMTVPIGQSGFEFAWTATDDVGVQKVTLNDVEIVGEAGSYKTTVSLRDGANVFEIKAFDAAGNVDKKSATLTRPADLSKPGIVPPLDRTVGVQDSAIQLTWKITNSKKAVKALLNGVEIPVDSQIVRTASLVPGPNSFTLLVTDAAGAIYTGSVIITRTVEVILPSIVPLADRNVGVGDTSAILTWTITNSSKATAGTVNGQPVVVGPTVSQMVTVTPGSNRFVLLLQDVTGKSVTDTVFVIRAADATGPVLTWVAPATKTLPVESTVSSYVVQVKVTDASGIDSVWIGGVGSKKDGDVWSLTVALPSANGIPVVIQVRARDIYGNQTNDSVAITRAQGDITPPVITLISPKGDISVGSGKTEILIEAKATDAGSGVKSFTIASLDVMGTGSLTLGLKPGKNTVVLIAADSAGNTDTVTLVVTVIDSVPPVITLVSPKGDLQLVYGIPEYLIKATATDAGSGIQSFTIGGSAVVDTQGVVVGLHPGKNSIPLVAIDKSGNKDSITLTLNVEQYVSQPTFIPAKGTYTSAQTVTLQSETPGATIYYTLDGTNPVPGNGAIVYNKPIAVNETQTIKATAVAEGYSNSYIGIAYYTIIVPAAAPTFSLPTGTYGRVSVVLKTASLGADIYYTLDGTVPTSASTRYNGDSIPITESATLKAIAIGGSFLSSSVSTVTYTLNNKGTITDARDGQVYKTVLIGDQWWIAQNLNFATSNSACYDGLLSNCATYGRLYSWSDAMSISVKYDSIRWAGTLPQKGVCPTDWHLPSQDEWKRLESFVGDPQRSAEHLITNSGWEGTPAIDDYGFSAKPGGYGYLMPRKFNNIGREGSFWTSSLPDESSDQDAAKFVYFDNVIEHCSSDFNVLRNKTVLLSVRCIKD